MYEITEDILQKGGLTPSQYIISEELKNMVVPMAFIPKISVWDALQEIANAGLCKIYMDRQDRTIVRAESEVPIEESVRISPSNMFTYTSNITLTEFANSINVEYCEITLSDDLVDTAEIEVVLNPYESKVLECDYTSDIAYASAVLGPMSRPIKPSGMFISAQGLGSPPNLSETIWSTGSISLTPFSSAAFRISATVSS